jgi:hypothetical protein
MINKENVELIYKTNIREGVERFDGQPLPSLEVLNIIGQSGVNYIHNTLKLYRETKRKIFGRADKKVFFYKQQFFKVLGQPYTIEVLSDENNIDGDYRLIISDLDMTSYKRKKEVLRSMNNPIR